MSGRRAIRRGRSRTGAPKTLSPMPGFLLSDGRGGDRRPDELTPMFRADDLYRNDSLSQEGLCPGLLHWLIANGTGLAPDDFECDEECWCRVHRPRLVAIKEIVDQADEVARMNFMARREA